MSLWMIWNWISILWEMCLIWHSLGYRILILSKYYYLHYYNVLSELISVFNCIWFSIRIRITQWNAHHFGVCSGASNENAHITQLQLMNKISIESEWNTHLLKLIEWRMNLKFITLCGLMHSNSMRRKYDEKKHIQTVIDAQIRIKYRMFIILP